MSENVFFASTLYHRANGYHEFNFGTTENKFWRAENISLLESCPDEAVLFIQIFFFCFTISLTLQQFKAFIRIPKAVVSLITKSNEDNNYTRDEKAL
jgi:hypothetical protein